MIPSRLVGYSAYVPSGANTMSSKLSAIVPHAGRGTDGEVSCYVSGSQPQRLALGNIWALTK